MFIQAASCTSCSAEFIVDTPLWQSGIELLCPECGMYFVPPGAPGGVPAEQICKASVPIRVWAPTGRVRAADQT
jgi:hypothetical protein